MVGIVIVLAVVAAGSWVAVLAATGSSTPAPTDRAATAAPVAVPPVPATPTAVVWRERSDVVPVAAGAGAVVIRDDRAAGLDGTSGQERWSYEEPKRTPSALGATPDGKTVLVTYEADEIIVGLDAMTGNVRFRTVIGEQTESVQQQFRTLDLGESSSSRLTNSALVLELTSTGNLGRYAIVSFDTGAVERVIDAAESCGGPEPQPSVDLAEDSLAIACWTPASDDDSASGTAGVLQVFGRGTDSGKVDWRAPDVPFVALAAPGGRVPKPQAAMTVSPDRSAVQVSWKVEGEFVSGGQTQFIDIETGGALQLPEGGNFTVSGLYSIDAHSLISVDDGRTYACPVTLAPGYKDCFGPTTSSHTAVSTGVNWIGACDPATDEHSFSSKTAEICVRGLDPSSGAYDTITLDSIGLDPSEWSQTEVRTLLCPGAVLAVAGTPDEGYEVSGLR
ncbi:hypothetical protein [Agreia bicolorata]|uniref:hypothetical protein n=1 Tax=Agreia bicolorata TaxID=110935 RepID=UPI0011167FB4|nr:hypothetical protein [Agreia bicolorata]